MNDMYEVWMTQGGGGALGPDFETLDEALQYAMKGIANKEGSFAIKYPNGDWHEWENL